ncbi:hypothetical protein Taro_053877 [Colocasia esculenta]|nr:hypothetical protein [Colocasia esculenta]
MRWGRM